MPGRSPSVRGPGRQNRRFRGCPPRTFQGLTDSSCSPVSGSRRHLGARAASTTASTSSRAAQGVQQLKPLTFVAELRPRPQARRGGCAPSSARPPPAALLGPAGVRQQVHGVRPPQPDATRNAPLLRGPRARRPAVALLGLLPAARLTEQRPRQDRPHRSARGSISWVASAIRRSSGSSGRDRGRRLVAHKRPIFQQLGSLRPSGLPPQQVGRGGRGRSGRDQRAAAACLRLQAVPENGPPERRQLGVHGGLEGRARLGPAPPRPRRGGGRTSTTRCRPHAESPRLHQPCRRQRPCCCGQARGVRRPGSA